MAEPSKINAYLTLARINRPVGTLLLLWPTLAALWAAAEQIPRLDLVIIFTIGTFLMRSAGCVMNDLADRNIDAQVRRTDQRPLARGDISVTEAVMFLALLLVLAAFVLLFLNNLTRFIALGGLVLALSYPFFKRWTYLPQVPLGAAFSWGLIMAYSATLDTVPQQAWVLFIGSLLWIVAYDTLYAMADREDDLRIGVKSTAILFGTGDRFFVGLLQVCALFAFYLFGKQSEFQIFYFIALGVMAMLFIYQLRLVADRDPAACLDAFRNNTWVGFVLLLGIACEVYFAPQLAS